MSLRIVAGTVLLAAIAQSPAASAGDAIGAALFRRAWVPAPSSTRADDGLGPHFDARSCAACHPGGDRPHLSDRLDERRSGEMPRGMVVRLVGSTGAPDPVYGRQLQGEAVIGVAAEATLRLASDGRTPRRLRPLVADLSHGPLAADTTMSLRLAPALFGSGAVEAVPEAAIRALADPDDNDGDGISGRVAELIDTDGRPRLGRWGFKATDVDLPAQVAAAFATDMGLSTALRPEPRGDCTERQTDCRGAPVGAPDSAGPHEIDTAIVARISAFLADLRRPDPTPAPPPSPRGAAVWAALGCPACHAPLEGGGRIVHSDLLLHDLGPGLSSGGGASGREWRTTPLLGLGDRLARRLPLLHDGRAGTLAQAVAWHDGEAAAARRRFAALSSADARALRDHLAGFRGP